MNEKSENKLDQLFKDGVSGSEDHIAFREEDWESMERLLDGKSNKKAILFRVIYYASGIAALLLLAIGLYFYSKEKTDPTNTNLQSKNTKNQPKRDDDQNDHPVKIPATKLLQPQQESLGSNSTQSQTPFPLTIPAKGRKDPYPGIIPFKGYDSLLMDTAAARANNLMAGKTKKDTIKDKAVNLATNNALSNNKTQKTNVAAVDTIFDKDKIASANNGVKNNIAIPDTITQKAAAKEAKKQLASVKTSAVKNQPQFSISILAASDANAVNSFNHSQTGTNYGIQFSVRLTRKLIISTGAAYAIKPYSSSSGSYNSSSYNPSITPTNIQANCKVLDIPLNVSYQLYSKGNNAIALGTGLSSYFMLKENYRFDYSAQSRRKPYNLEIRNQNTHLFSVININADYQRRINSKFSLVVQPYMKLPVTGIGNGRVDLKSAGVALGINWNIGSALSPNKAWMLNSKRD